MRYQFYTADVFTDQIFGGNQLAVFPYADGLTTRQMQKVARELNLSETTFVLPPDDPANTFKVRIFTPMAELPFAGHPTVGTVFVLASIGRIPLESDEVSIIFEEKVGPVPVSIQLEGGQPKRTELSAAMMPEVDGQVPDIADLAEMLGLDASELRHDHYRPEIVSCGMPVLFIPLNGRESLAKIQMNTERYFQLHEAYPKAGEPYVFFYDLPKKTVYARLFAPALGIIEDPATGAAAAALAGYLGHREAQTSGVLNWTVIQGVEMGRPSQLDVEAEKADGQMTAIRVGGASVMVSEGMMEIPAL